MSIMKQSICGLVRGRDEGGGERDLIWSQEMVEFVATLDINFGQNSGEPVAHLRGEGEGELREGWRRRGETHSFHELECPIRIFDDANGAICQDREAMNRHLEEMPGKVGIFLRELTLWRGMEFA
jgi:hypothetical protein